MRATAGAIVVLAGSHIITMQRDNGVPVLIGIGVILFGAFVVAVGLGNKSEMP